MNTTRLNRNIHILNIVAFIALSVTAVMVFFYAPVERTMGNLHRILYFHVGSAWAGSIVFFVALVCGILYLRRPDRKWDTIAHASVEIGIIFLTMAIAAGSVWGKPAWNTWWIWSPRLTLVTVAWLTYAAYFMLRGAVESEEKRARFSAIYVIIAFLTIIMTFASIRILRDIHPVVIGEVAESAEGLAQGESEIAAGVDSMKMGITLMASTIAFTIVYAAWLLNRIRLQHLSETVNDLKLRVMAQLQGGSGD